MTSFAGQRDAATSESHGRVRLAYLLSAYPAISHTFFLNEIAELRKRGFSIDVASINKPHWPSDSISGQVSGALASTFYIKDGKPLQIGLILLGIFLTSPVVVWRGIRSLGQLGDRGASAKVYSLFYLAEALILGDWLRRRGHTHLHIHFGGPVATVGMLTSIAWEIPYSITIHGPEEFYGIDQSYLRKKVEKATFVLCISDYCRSQLMKLSEPTQWNKLQVVRLGVDVHLFTPSLSRKRGDCLELVCVGRLVPDKGQLVLLRALSRLLFSGHRLRLRLIGDGIDRRRLEAFILENNLRDSVILEGALSHEATRRLLGEADIFVLASFAEGLPIALMEAMAMEIPCVSTYVAGIPELIRSEVDGLLVPASSEEALVETLERLICNPGLRSALARSGRQRVLDLYDLQANVGFLAEALRNRLRQCDVDQSPQSAVARPKGALNDRVAT
jgi:colanic acid/amylovoran biosynthesis glycosyltransferase